MRQYRATRDITILTDQQLEEQYGIQIDRNDPEFIVHDPSCEIQKHRDFKTIEAWAVHFDEQVNEENSYMRASKTRTTKNRDDGDYRHPPY